MTIKQFIKHVEDRIEEGYWDREYDLVHVWKDVDLSGVRIKREYRTGKGFIYPDSVYFDPDTDRFVELVTIED